MKRNNICQTGSIWKLFRNTGNIFLSLFSHSFYFLTQIYYHLKNLPGQKNQRDIFSYLIYIFNIKIRCSWILWKLFVNRNIICQIIIFSNRNNVQKMKLLRIGNYLWPEYQLIYLWQIYYQTICKLFANRELFADHCPREGLDPLDILNPSAWRQGLKDNNLNMESI